MKRKTYSRVTVRVPGSTSNCGAGFDTLGLALGLYNDITLTRGDWRGSRPATPGDTAGLDMADEAARLFFVRAGVEEFGFTLGITGAVPMSRGLGSSVTLRAGVVAGLNELAGARLTKDDFCSLVTQLEGHPDNATPAVIGGFVVARSDPHTGELAGVVRKPIGRELCFVVVAPEQELETKKADLQRDAELVKWNEVMTNWVKARCQEEKAAGHITVNRNVLKYDDGQPPAPYEPCVGDQDAPHRSPS